MADKTISGLLNGIMKREYFNETDITDAFLKEQLFPDETIEMFNATLTKYYTIFKNMVYSDMDLKQLEAFLTSQMKKRSDFLSDAQAASIIKFWKVNKQKIHDVIVDRCTWNNKLKSFKWRIDVNYDETDKAGEATAVFEMDLEKKSFNSKHEKVLFEVDLQKLNEVISQVETIESKISKFIS